MCSGDDVATCYEHAATFVLGEEAQPGGLTHQDLPGKGTEGGAFAADNAPGLDMWTNAAFC